MSKYCSRCGKPSDDNAVFCDNCGQKFISPNQTPQQNRVSQGTAPQPNRQAPPMGYPGQPVRQAPPQPAPQKKSNVGLIVAVCVSAGVLVSAALIVLAFVLFTRPNTPPVNPTYPSAVQRETNPLKNKATEKPTEKVTQKPTEKPTEKVTQKPTEKPEQPKTEAPKKKTADYSSVGEPSDDDFTSWFLRATQAGAPDNSHQLFTGSEISGEWKGLLYFGTTGVWDLDNIEILAGDRAATVHMKHKYIKVDGSGYHRDNTPTYTLEGAVDSGSLNAYGQSGSLELYVFYEYDGKQYALGKYTNPSGEKADVGLVRP